MENLNIRVLPRVCGICKDLILPPFKNIKGNETIEVCKKCSDKK